MKNRKPIVILVSVMAAFVLCLCCCGSTVGFLAWDPFQWHLTDLLFGGDPVTRAVPGDAQIAFSLNLQNLNSKNTAAVIKAFSAASNQGKPKSLDDFVKDQIDPSLENSLGVTFSDDIKPWIGAHFDLAAFGSLFATGSNPNASKIVLLIESRNQAKTDAFITKLMDAQTRKMRLTWSDSSYKDVTIHEGKYPHGGSYMVLARSGEIFLMSTDEGALEQVIDTQKSGKNSLADASEYRSLAGKLPGSRALMVYLGADALKGSSGQSLPILSGQGVSGVQNGYLNAVKGMAFSVMAVKEGIRFDSAVAYDENKLTGNQRTMLAAADAADDIKRMPDNTLAFIRGQRLDLAWTVYRDSMAGASPGMGFDDTMAQIEKQTGVNPDKDLFPYLSGDWSLVLLPDKDGFLAKSGTDIGFAFMSNTNNETKLKGTIAALNSYFQAQNKMVSVSSVRIADIDAFSASTAGGGSGQLIAVYGVGQSHLTIASSSHVFEDLNNGGSSIADADLYKRAWAGLPSGLSPVEFIDVQGVYQLLVTPALEKQLAGITNILKPIRTIAAGSRAAGGGIYLQAVLIAIDE